MSISLGKRLQWAEISFSGTCHESRYETPFGEAEITLFFFCLCGQVWIMPCVEDGPLYQIVLCHFFLSLFYLRIAHKCAREREREREPVQDCNKTYFHACVFN